MAICRFYEQGTCRYGNNCKNEHISSNHSNSGRGRGGYNAGSFGPGRGAYSAGSNAFSSARGGFNSFQNNHNRGGFAHNSNRSPFDQRNGPSGPNRTRERWTVDTKIIKTDLTAERPIWPFSCYAPKSDAPRQLIEGKLEISPEEMRVEAYKLVAQGKNTEIVSLFPIPHNLLLRKRTNNPKTQIEATAAAEMQKSIQTVLADLNGAVKYVADGRDVHPNRHDVEDGVDAQSGSRQVSASANSAANPFSSTAIANNPFGQTPQSSTDNPFGQAKAATPFGQAAASPFASAINSQQSSMIKPNPFGQTNQAPASSGFGQPSMLGQGRLNPFGTNTSAAQGPTNAASPFGPSKPASPFGQTPAANPFGQPASHTTDSSMMSPTSKPNPFATSSQPSSQSQAQISASPFGQSSTTPSPFGPSLSSQTSSTLAPPTGPKANPFGQPSQPSPSPFAETRAQSGPSPFAKSAQPLTGSSNFAQNRNIFDKGVPTEPHVDDPPQILYGDHEAEFQKAYDHAKQHGVFDNGIMPMLPPKTAWISYENL